MYYITYVLYDVLYDVWYVLLLHAGRMRAWGGRVVAIVNEKLYLQYKENKRKERMMAAALEKVRSKSALFILYSC